MRFWLLTSETPQEYAGGIARYADTFARVAGGAGHEVTLIARMQEQTDTQLAPGVRLIGFVPRYEQRHIPQHSSRPDQHPTYPDNVIGAWPGLSYQLAETVLDVLRNTPAPDIIEVQEFGGFPYYLLQRKLTERGPLEHIPVLAHLHTAYYDLLKINQEPRYRFPEYWIGQMEKFCIRAADALLSPSKFLADHTRRTLGNDLAITTIPYPMLLPPASLDTIEAIPGEIVCVGRLELRKGTLSLLAACAEMWERGADFRLTLIGGDTQFRPRDTTVGTFLRQRYAHWVDAGLLKLPGQMSQAAVLAHVRGAWAAVVPSLWENFPNTCIEAMGLGQVVLGSRSGGQAEMIAEDGVNGFLFDWNVPGEFEHKLQQVLVLSPDERRSIGQRAQQRIRELCNPEQVLQQRIAHFGQVIEQTTTRRIFPSMLEAQLPVAPAILRESEQSGLLSVVIPFYNLGAYVEETVASVLASTYRPLEIVIVDDGSTDSASTAVLAQLTTRHTEIRVVRVPNGGLARARNLGADAARGEFLAFLDADDTIEPDYYARSIDVLHRYDNVAFVYSWVRWFESADHIWPTWNAEFPYLLGHNMLAAFVVMPRARFLQAARNKPELAYSLEDFEAWITLVEAGGVGVSLPHPLVNYRIRKGSMFRGSQRDQQLYLYELISELHPQAYQRWGAELFHLQNANGPAYTWNHPVLPYTLPMEEITDLQPLRDAIAGGIWISDMLRGGRVVAQFRRSWLVRTFRERGGLRLLRRVLQIFRR
ncbi:MAG: glycosyltransferase [Roseiflexaceae bacterium]|nr:glycosyltransferase [Roseiflexaceae bacterium]